jgi:hypothetical protein
MKCRACWTDKAYRREVSGWRRLACTWLGMVPLKCHHCYHKFTVPWPLTIGKRLSPPAMKIHAATVTASGQRQFAAQNAQADSESAGQRLRRVA